MPTQGFCTSHPRTPGDLQVCSGAPNPRDAVQQLQHLCGPKAGPALGWAHRGSGCSSLGARGISCGMLRPPSSTLHQPIHAAKIPPLGTSTFQPPPTGTGLCWTTNQPLLAQFQHNTCHTVGPGTAGPEPGTWVLSTPALCPQSCCVQPGPPANPPQERFSSLQRSVSGGATRILNANGQKPLGIHRAQELVLYCHV